MAQISASLYFAGIREYKIDTIPIDLIIDESHTMSNTITQHRIENGSIISDHIQNNLRTGDLTGLISNFSLKKAGILSNRAQDTFDKLKELWQKRKLVDISTIHDVYQQVGILNINPTRTEDTGEVLEFAITFQEVNIVNLKEITIEASINLTNMNSDINRKLSNELNRGKTNPTSFNLGGRF